MSQNVANAVFDFAVNMGASQAHKLVQRSLAKLGQKVRDDGVLGDLSLMAINAVKPIELLIELAHQAAKFYITISLARVVRYGTKEGLKYLEGWLTRAYDIVKIE